MPNIPNTTRAQTLFLRAFRTSPTGPDRKCWPAPALLRRWLRKPAFRAALASVREALRFQADFHVATAATAATAAAQRLAEHPDLTTQDLNRLVRAAHLRQRFTDDNDPANTSTAVPSTDEPAEPAPPQPCYKCFRRAQNPFWIEDHEAFKTAAWKEGYAPPFRDFPDFPDPVPQDTFYYQLLQSPAALLWYLHRYDQAGHHDHRFSPILTACKLLIPREDPGHHDLPRFPAERAALTSPAQ